MTLVFPDPAPAIISTGPSRLVTAWYWGSFNSFFKAVRGTEIFAESPGGKYYLFCNVYAMPSKLNCRRIFVVLLPRTSEIQGFDMNRCVDVVFVLD